MLVQILLIIALIALVVVIFVLNSRASSVLNQEREHSSELKDENSLLLQNFSALEQKNDSLEVTIQSLSQQIEKFNQEVEEKRVQNVSLLQNSARDCEKIASLVQEKVRLEEDIQEVKRLNNEQILAMKAEFKESFESKKKEAEEEDERNKKMFNTVFENIATKILENKSSDFLTKSSSEVKRIIEPLSKELQDFKQRADTQHTEQTREQASLKVELSKLFELNHRLGDEASSLVKAIKGESNPKFQGDWGEMILDKILSTSGLVEGEHYFTQESTRNDQNEIIRPDVTIRYPDGREVIIDSKVSLSAYVRYVSASDSDLAEKALSDHILSVKRHIDSLSDKRYDYNSDSLDFVMMFMPVEPAYLLALASDAALWEYAYKKKIILVSPTHLITALKLVYDLWSRDAQNKNAIEIANRGALMLDKFAGFVADMEAIKRNLATTSKSYENAMTKLSSGTGNLMRQAEMLSELGVRSTKKLKNN